MTRRLALLAVLCMLWACGAVAAWAQAAARPGDDDSEVPAAAVEPTEVPRPPQFTPVPQAMPSVEPSEAPAPRGVRGERSGSSIQARPILAVLIVGFIVVACWIPVRRKAQEKRKPDYRRVTPVQSKGSRKTWDV